MDRSRSRYAFCAALAFLVGFAAWYILSVVGILFGGLGMNPRLAALVGDVLLAIPGEPIAQFLGVSAEGGRWITGVFWGVVATAVWCLRTSRRAIS